MPGPTLWRRNVTCRKDRATCERYCNYLARGQVACACAFPTVSSMPRLPGSLAKSLGNQGRGNLNQGPLLLQSMRNAPSGGACRRRGPAFSADGRRCRNDAVARLQIRRHRLPLLGKPSNI